MTSPRNAIAYQGARHYTYLGREFPSVTTILNAYPKPWLGAWAAKQVATLAVMEDGWHALEPEEQIKYLKGSPWRTRDKAGDFGTILHESLQQLVADADVVTGAGAEEHVAALREWWEAYRPDVTDSEVQVLNLTAGYAGSLDLIAEVYGRRMLIDLKSGSVLAHDMRLQLAAYRYAESIFADGRIISRMPEVEACAVLWIPRDHPRDWQFVDVDAGGAEYAEFLHLLATHEYIRVNKTRAVGELILPQAVEV